MALTALEARTPPATGQRSVLRAVAVPSEHGGWGLTAEPALLGLLIAPGIAGVCLGLAAMVAFVAHTPLRVVLVDGYRHRRLVRTRVALRVLAAELAVIAVLVALATRSAEPTFWWPAAVAAPLVGVSLWFDARSRSRRLAPELAGTVGISSVVAMVLLAGGDGTAAAVAAWLVLSARAVTSIPHVRARIAALHGRVVEPRSLVVADVAAVTAAIVAVALFPPAAPGAVAVVVVVATQRLTAGRPVVPKVLGLRQMVLGLLVVLGTALGFNLA